GRPSIRQGPRMACDAGRDETVLFGGDSPGVYIGDTWNWSGNEWTRPSTSGPSVRSFHAMAYDSGRGVTVLFGGYYYNGTEYEYGDTWEWDGITWTLRSTSGPPPRHYHAMVYDSARGVSVLFGGNRSNVDQGDTWEWNGSTWTLRSFSGP